MNCELEHMYQSGIQMWNPSVEYFRLLLLFVIYDLFTGGMGRQHSVLHVHGYPHHHIYYVSVFMYLFF